MYTRCNRRQSSSSSNENKATGYLTPPIDHLWKCETGNQPDGGLFVFSRARASLSLSPIDLVWREREDESKSLSSLTFSVSSFVGKHGKVERRDCEKSASDTLDGNLIDRRERHCTSIRVGEKSQNGVQEGRTLLEKEERMEGKKSSCPVSRCFS